MVYSGRHPSRDDPDPFHEAGVGSVSGLRFGIDGDDDDVDERPTSDDRVGTTDGSSGVLPSASTLPGGEGSHPRFGRRQLCVRKRIRERID